MDFWYWVDFLKVWWNEEELHAQWLNLALRSPFGVLLRLRPHGRGWGTQRGTWMRTTRRAQERVMPGQGCHGNADDAIVTNFSPPKRSRVQSTGDASYRTELYHRGIWSELLFTIPSSPFGWSKTERSTGGGKWPRVNWTISGVKELAWQGKLTIICGNFGCHTLSVWPSSSSSSSLSLSHTVVVLVWGWR